MSGGSEKSMDLFRRHRHDVLNELQLVRAYMQMNRTDKALSIVDRTAAWLQSLSRWNDISGEHGEQLVFHASTCPSVVLSSISVSAQPNALVVQELSTWMTRMQTALSEVGARIQVTLHISESECSIRIHHNSDEVNQLMMQVESWTEFSCLHFV